MVAAQTITWDATLSIMRELTDLYSGTDTDDISDASSIPALVEDVRKASEDIRTSLASQVDVLEGEVREAEARCERENVEEAGAKMKELGEREER